MNNPLSSSASDELIKQAKRSAVYAPLLIDREFGIADFHNWLVSKGGIRKDDCFSSSNITDTSYFGTTYLGMTSGRSGYHCEYRKGSSWLKSRDRHRRAELTLRARSAYSVINIASRLFPHDKHDVTVVSASIDSKIERGLLEILDYLKSLDLHIFWRGFPNRLCENIDVIQRLCSKASIDRASLITTGLGARRQQSNIIQKSLSGMLVIDEYGAQDCGIQIYSCSECGLFHANNPRSLISIVGANIYATDLYSFGQPVIAIDTGDRAVVSEDVCMHSGQQGFLPKPIPGAIIQHPRPQAKSGTEMLVRPSFITAFNADQDLYRLIQLTGSGHVEELRNEELMLPSSELYLLANLASEGRIGLCRERLKSLLCPNMLQQFSHKRTSLISYLISHLMIMSGKQWSEEILEIWICPQDNGGVSSSINSLEQTLDRIIEGKNCSGEWLTNLYIYTTRILIRILHDPAPGEFLVGSSGLACCMEELRVFLTPLSPNRIKAALPILTPLKSYLLAHLWQYDAQLMDLFLEYWQGSESKNIAIVEDLYRSGAMRKF